MFNPRGLPLADAEEASHQKFKNCGNWRGRGAEGMVWCSRNATVP